MRNERRSMHNATMRYLSNRELGFVNRVPYVIPRSVSGPLRSAARRARQRIANTPAQTRSDRAAISRIRLTRADNRRPTYRYEIRGGQRIRVRVPRRVIAPPGYSHYPPLP